VATLPVLTQTIDDIFTETWYEIRAEAADNILNATPIWAALKAAGCMKTQVGGNFITRTIRYGTESVKEVEKGDTLDMGEPELETMAMWDWRYTSAHVQRSLIDDQKNAGKFKIKEYVGKRISASKDALTANFETVMTRAARLTETGKGTSGLNDLLPLYADRATGTFGKIVRSNEWWRPVYKSLTLPMEVNLVSDMRNIYNTIMAGGVGSVPPNLIITTQDLFELYEDFGLNVSQIIKDSGGTLVDLGFDVLRFKGKPMIWSAGVVSAAADQQMLFLNTDHIELVYDPNMWFAMTEWKPIPLQNERIAHFMCAVQMVSDELRRHGRLAEDP